MSPDNQIPGDPNLIQPSPSSGQGPRLGATGEAGVIVVARQAAFTIGLQFRALAKRQSVLNS